MMFSIIVPVYNVEKYLDNCIKSLLNQNFNDYEIILIDDGSTDKSGEICDKYADINNRIKVFHKENEGLSATRNLGIKYSKGDYLIFVDSDDWIAKESLLEFSKIIKKSNAEVIETRIIEVFNVNELICDINLEKYIKHGFSQKKAVRWILKKSHNTWQAQKRIYLSSFIKENKIYFLNGRLHEDIAWTSNIILKAKNYDVCLYPWYYYRKERECSITNNISAKNIIDVIEIASMYYKKFLDNSTYLSKKIVERLMISVYIKIWQVKKCSKEEKKKIIECINKNKQIFKIAPKIEHKIFVLFMKFFGVKNTINFIR